MAQSAQTVAAHSVSAPTPGAEGSNRKKQKRRAKADLRSQADADHVHDYEHLHPKRSSSPAKPNHYHAGTAPSAKARYPDDVQYSDEDDHVSSYNSAPHTALANGHAHHHDPQHSQHKRKQRPPVPARNASYAPNPSDILNTAMNNLHLPSPPHMPLPKSSLRQPARSLVKPDRIWNTSTLEERERIKEFWLSLSEDERKSLLRIEKEAVLRKMKEQQKHSCSCTVCGRKRTAIEEELEVLYDAYYDELEQYANVQPPHLDQILPAVPDRQRALPPPVPVPATAGPYPPRPIRRPTYDDHHPPRTGRVREVSENGKHTHSEEDYDLPEGDEDSYSDSYEDDSYDDDPYERMPDAIGTGFFDFGNSLTVKGGILTVADDLLQNDGRKFIEMMEQLAERRMQREQDAEYAATQPSHHPPPLGPPLDDDDEYDDDDDYDSQDDYERDYPEDEMSGMTEEQRMEEGRRMFQIFAARMFEQRVLTAYREKVAAERQRKLLEELEDETRQDAQREAKKLKDAEKKKSKKLASKHAKAEAQAQKEAEKSAQEAAAKAEQERVQQEQRDKKEAQKKKKEAQKKASDEERLRKEAEKQKRLNEERDRQQDAERKAREQRELKAQEKKLREEAKAKEEEEKAAEAQRIAAAKAKEATAKAKAMEAAASKPPATVTNQQANSVRKNRPRSVTHNVPSQAKSNINNASPALSIATPVVPKVAVASRPKQATTRELVSPVIASAKTTNGTSTPSDYTTDGSAPRSNIHTPVYAIDGPSQMRRLSQFAPPSSMNYMPVMPNHFDTGMPAHVALNGAMGPLARPPGMPPLGQHPPAFQHREPQAQPISGNVTMPAGREHNVEAPPGLFARAPPVLGQSPMPVHGSLNGQTSMPMHNRQSSASGTFDGRSNHLARPAPIQRPASGMHSDPSSVEKQKIRSGELDDTNRHLGSSALLDDADEPLPVKIDTRKFSNPPGMNRLPSAVGYSPPRYTTVAGQAPLNGVTSNWSSQSTFAAPNGGMGTPMWGNAQPTSGAWPTNTFGGAPRQAHVSRPLAIRLAVCQACRQLARGNFDVYHNVSLLLRQIDLNGPLPEGRPSLAELEDICETEGDAQNGGGMLSFRQLDEGAYGVKFEPNASMPGITRVPPGQLGEIGSPISPNTSSQYAQQPRGLGKLGAGLAPLGNS